MSKVIFISSPYNHHTPEVVEDNFKKVSTFAAKLCSEGHVALSPITNGHTLLGFKEMPATWEFWQNFCLSLLSKADEMYVYQMEGWDKSGGVASEIQFAIEHNIPVKYIPYEL
jgi:hypothetical protein